MEQFYNSKPVTAECDADESRKMDSSTPIKFQSLSNIELPETNLGCVCIIVLTFCPDTFVAEVGCFLRILSERPIRRILRWSKLSKTCICLGPTQVSQSGCCIVWTSDWWALRPVAILTTNNAEDEKKCITPLVVAILPTSSYLPIPCCSSRDWHVDLILKCRSHTSVELNIFMWVNLFQWV